jgi:hypothetical protein
MRMKAAWGSVSAGHWRLGGAEVVGEGTGGLGGAGFADLGLFVEAWETLEELPFDKRLGEQVIAVRLRVCTGLQTVGMGVELSKLIDSRQASQAREACGRFLSAHSDYLHAAGDRDGALAQVKAAVAVWPEGKEAALAAKVMQVDCP